MRRRTCVPAAVAALLLLPAVAEGASAAPPPGTRVKAAQDRIAALERRMAGLIAEMQTLEDATAATSARLGVSRLLLAEAQEHADRARAAYGVRAREAYKRGTWRTATVLLGADSFPALTSLTRFVEEALTADLGAYRRLVAARDELARLQSEAAGQKRDLVAATGNLERVRAALRQALDSEQAVLASAREELARLEAARRRAAGGVSPAVEARRAARQAELDRKLADVLAWYAPGRGPEPYLPPQLRGTEVTSTGAASWYGPGFDGRRASSGCTFRAGQLTAASLVLPFGTFLKVSLNGRAAVVVVTDRGPYVQGRVLDLSQAAAEAIGLTGVKQVRMEILIPNEPAPPFP